MLGQKEESKRAPKYPAEGFGKKAIKAEGPSVQQKSKTDDGMTETLEKMILLENFSKWIDGIYEHMPPACDLVWKESQQAWVDLAMNHPIALNNGECTVHLFGISHGDPTNASALRAVVEAVQPDTIAIEQAPQNSKRLRAAAQELAPQLDKLMALGFPVGIKEAHMALSPPDRRRWRQVIFEGELALKAGDREEYTREKIDLMLFGQVPYIEFLAAARLAPSGNDGISLEGIDLEARSKENRLLDDPGHAQEYSDQLGQILGPESHMLQKQGSDEAFDVWQEKVAQMDGFMNGTVASNFINTLGFVSLCPAAEEKSKRFDSQKEAETHMTGKAAAYAQALEDGRNLQMLDRLEMLAEGRWSAGGPLRPRKVIVAVVGRMHVAPKRELAAKEKCE